MALGGDACIIEMTEGGFSSGTGFYRPGGGQHRVSLKLPDRKPARPLRGGWIFGTVLHFIENNCDDISREGLFLNGSCSGKRLTAFLLDYYHPNAELWRRGDQHFASVEDVRTFGKNLKPDAKFRIHLVDNE